jgi:hypothetical protein
MGRNHCQPRLGWHFGNCDSCAICYPDTKGATGARLQLRGIEVQLQGGATSVASGAPVIFDTMKTNQTSFIAYNAVTGTITITQSGLYHINWWVGTDGILGGTDVFITFNIVTSQGDSVKASAPVVTGQIVGNGLIQITASTLTPVTMQLVNATDGSIDFASTPIKANLTIVAVNF